MEGANAVSSSSATMMEKADAARASLPVRWEEEWEAGSPRVFEEVAMPGKGIELGPDLAPDVFQFSSLAGQAGIHEQNSGGEADRAASPGHSVFPQSEPKEAA